MHAGEGLSPGTDGVRIDDLPLLGLQQVGHAAVQYPRRAHGQCGCMLAGVDPLTPCFHPYDANAVLLHKLVVQPCSSTAPDEAAGSWS